MSDEAPKKTTVSITVDGRPHEAKPGQLVIEACEEAGTYVPRFCYHRRMESVGMCRQCLVEIEGPRGPALVVSCMTPVAENQVVLTESPTVKKAQEGVLEFLLANHPLDCPVCDKGGECPLQDQAFSHGPGESRFVEEKRHFAKPIPISDLVFLDRERCILCDRCTRFAKDVAGDPLIHFISRGNDTQVMTFPDEPFASYFSGNTVQICPVGALTATPYRFKARPWDLTQTESTCTTCSVGCRITVQSSRDEILRYQGVDSDPVNWGWLCDKGRFGFEAINSAERLEHPVLLDQFKVTPVSWSHALASASAALRGALESGGASSIAALGGARLANEDAYVWAKLLKGFIGTDNVDAQLGDGLPAAVVFGLPAATIDEACAAPTIVLLGPDLKEELPVLYLRVRDVATKRKARLLELSPVGSGLTPYAWKSLRYKPGEQPAAVRALAGNGDPNVLGIDADELAEIRDQLAGGPIAVIAGRASLAESGAFTADALAALHQSFPAARFLVALRRGNVRGALDLGLTPGFVPGHTALAAAGDALRRAWPNVPDSTGLDARGILEAAAAGRIGCLLLLGADPLNDFPDRDLAVRGLAGAAKIIAVDTFINDSSKHADVVLPAAAFTERAGTTTNIEGRITTLSQKVTARGHARADWIIATDLAARLGHDLGVESLEQIRAEIAEVSPVHSAITEDLLHKQRDGVVVGGGGAATLQKFAAADAPLPNAYDFRLVVSRKLYDAGITLARSRSLAGLAPGARLHLHPLDVERLGVTDGTLVKISSPRTSLSAAVASSAAVPRGSAWMAFNQGDVEIGTLIDASEPVIDVRVETLWIFAVDPLVVDHVGVWAVGIIIVKVILGFVFCLIGTLFMVWFERKVIAGMQNRVGPNKAGPWGLLQTLADGIKAFFKEDLLPERADRLVFRLAPFLAVVPAFVTFSVIPIAGDFSVRALHPGQISVWGHLTTIQVADPPIGILLVLAASSIGVYGVMLAGWSSGSKYPLLGAVRASAQMVSYEAALGLAVATVVMVVGSLSTLDIVRAQDSVVRWNLVATGFIPFVVFVIAATAELNRPPFDLVEAEQELVGGYHTEYAGIRFALFYLAEFMGTVNMSAIIVTLFLGGPAAPFDFLARIPGNIHDLGGPDVIHGLWHFLGSPILWGAIWFFAKLFIFLFMYVWFRATLPRFRYDQLMDLGWKVLIPISFGWFLVLTSLRVAQDQGWNRVVVVAIAVAVMLAGFGLLSSALRVSSRRRQLEGTVF